MRRRHAEYDKGKGLMKQTEIERHDINKCKNTDHHLHKNQTDNYIRAF